MTYLSERQVKLLLLPINPNRVRQRDGQPHVEGYDIRAELSRVFGFGRWSSEVLDQALLCEKETKTKRGADAWYVLYRSRIRLTIHAPDGTLVCYHDGSHVGASTHPDIGEAHGNALTNSETYALRRAAINLGDQFGLSLYNKGSEEALVRWTMVRPEAETHEVDTNDVPKVEAEDFGSSSAGSDEEHATPPRDVSEPELADKARMSRPGLTPEQIRDEALNSVTAPERISELLALAERDYPDVVLVNGSGDDERLVDQLKRAIDERTPASSMPQRQRQQAPAPPALAGEEEWIRDFSVRLASSGPGEMRGRQVEVMTAKSANLITAATANELLAEVSKRKAEIAKAAA